MQRSLILALVASALVIVGCGSSKSAGAPASAVTTALSYLPADSPFVITTKTTPNPGGQALVKRLPNLALAETAIFAKLSQLGIDYNNDVRPLFGNPLVAGLVLRTGSGTPNGFLAAWVTKDASKLSALIKKLGPGLHSVGTRDGATMYLVGSLALAIDGATAVIASNQQVLTSALDRHAQGGGITAADYTRAFTGLPQDGQVQTFGTLTRVLSSPRAAKARSVPWVGALRGYAASINESSTGLTFRYRLDTTGRPLTAVQLPFAGGTTAPSFAGSLPIVAAVRDPAQIYSFAQSAVQITNPKQYGDFLKRQATARAKTGVDLTSLVALATGDLIVDSDTRTTIGRVTVSDPAKAKTMIDKLASDPRALFRTPPTIRRLGGGFYELKPAHSSKAVTVGIVGNQLVAGQATPARLRAFATAPASPAAGAQGAVAFRIALADVVRLASKHPPSGIGAKIIGMLGDLTGWSAASPSGVTGSATLTVK